LEDYKNGTAKNGRFSISFQISLITKGNTLYVFLHLFILFHRVVVKMKNLLNGNTWLWERGKFMNRRYLMQEMYQKYLDGEDISKIKHEEDPFWEPAEDVLIGTSNVFLQSLGYALDFDDKICVTDYKGQEEGSIYINVTPCTNGGKPLDEDFFIDDPKDLMGDPYHFKVSKWQRTGFIRSLEQG
jgi:hypothetical protein